ncbi:MAG: hypothetical protein QE263_09340 [Vampirovibrionales bacterium]|nr:hypothetical protein [Vampirovibrionales bacterium]
MKPLDNADVDLGVQGFLSPARLVWAAGLFAAGLALPLVFRKPIGRWLFKGADEALQLTKAKITPTKGIIEKSVNEGHDLEYTQFNTIQNPILSTAILAVDPAMKPVVALYALVSVLGVVGGAFVEGLQETWVRSEETHIRKRALESLVTTYQQSIQRKEQLLQQLRERTWNTLAGFLTEAGVSNVAAYHPRWAGIPSLDALNKEHRKNYLLEPRPIGVPFGVGINKHLSSFGTNNSPPLLNTPDWMNVLATVFPFGFGAVVGLLLSGASQTWGRLKAVIDSTTQAANKKSMVTSVVAYDLEALAAISKRLGTPTLLLGYGLLVGAVGAGKSLISGLREIVVTQKNAHTEVAFQRENWLNISTRMMLAAETAWTTTALQRFQGDLPYLKAYPQALRQRVHGVINSIGFNSTPPHYLTSLGLTITEGSRR